MMGFFVGPEIASDDIIRRVYSTLERRLGNWR
jgi:hypothetical protein